MSETHYESITLPDGRIYPGFNATECEKVRQVSTQSRTISEFLEWLEDKGYEILRDDLNPRNEDLLYSFFEIDKKKVDEEKREVLAWIRVHQHGADPDEARAELGLESIQWENQPA